MGKKSTLQIVYLNKIGINLVRRVQCRGGLGRKFHGSGQAGFFPFIMGQVGLGHYKFSGLVKSEFLILGSKSGQATQA